MIEPLNSKCNVNKWSKDSLLWNRYLIRATRQMRIIFFYYCVDVTVTHFVRNTICDSRCMDDSVLTFSTQVRRPSMRTSHAPAVSRTSAVLDANCLPYFRRLYCVAQARLFPLSLNLAARLICPGLRLHLKLNNQTALSRWDPFTPTQHYLLSLRGKKIEDSDPLTNNKLE